MGQLRTAVVSLVAATVVLLGAWASLPLLTAVPGSAPPPATTRAPDPHSSPPPPASKRPPAIGTRPVRHKVVASPKAAPPAPGPLVPASDVYQVPGSGIAAGQKVIALTFDDGPDPVYTPQVLQVLGQAGVTATFFMIGWEANDYPDLVRQVAGAGDGVGNHTWNHVDLTGLSPAGLPAQVDRTTQLLDSLTGRRVTCIRPPQGHLNPGVESELSGRGLATVLWDDDPRDWTRPGTGTIIRRVLSEAQPGAIVELHDGGGDRSETVAALPVIIAALRAQGYRFVPVCV